MTQATTDVLPAPIAACAVRVARLASDGTTPAGAANGYCTQRFAKVSMKKEVEAGVEVLKKNACGALDVNYRERDTIKRWNLNLELTAPDPELEEMLTAATLLTSNLATTRTVADASITSGSTTVTSPTVAFTQNDSGAAISGTGIPVGARIAAVLSPTSATMTAAATATTTGTLSLTVTSTAITVGALGQPLGVTPTDFGVSLELWVKNVRGGRLDPLFPYRKVVFPASFWTPADPPDVENAQQSSLFDGYAVENPQWGNGPWNDWKVVKTGDTAVNLAGTGAPMAWHYTQLLPVTQIGYVAVPVQV